MSSVSSYEGSDKEHLFPKIHSIDNNTTPSSPSQHLHSQSLLSSGSASSPRHSYLRKTDLLDTLDTSRSRDTDTWSVAATIDDQESIISAHGVGPSSIISGSRMTMDRETDDDRSTLDGESSLRDRLSDMHLNEAAVSLAATAPNINTNATTPSRSEMLHDLIDHHHHHHLENSNHHHHPTSHLALLRGGDGTMLDDDDDKRSRSNAAEFGDDGARSATADFDHSLASDEEDGNSSIRGSSSIEGGSSASHHRHRKHRHHYHNVVDDQISAPPQPQPSFASVTNKSYAELLEENEALQSQLRDAHSNQKHQADMIVNLRNLTGCNDEIYGQALNLSEAVAKEDAISSSNNNNNSSRSSSNRSSNGVNNNINTAKNENLSSIDFDSSAMTTVTAFEQAPPIVNARTLTHKLIRLAETLTRFVHSVVDKEWYLKLEQALFLHITQLYLNSLPFGTENQHLLNTAYNDQISRFQSTLGVNFAKWYRRQTVQSLSLNPSTKEYLIDMRECLKNEVDELLKTMQTNETTPCKKPDERVWNELLDLCAALSLEIHGSDADVVVQNISVGSKFDEEMMAQVGDSKTSGKDKLVKMAISPLFVDEEQVVLLPARVVLEEEEDQA